MSQESEALALVKPARVKKNKSPNGKTQSKSDLKARRNLQAPLGSNQLPKIFRKFGFVR